MAFSAEMSLNESIVEDAALEWCEEQCCVARALTWGTLEEVRATGMRYLQVRFEGEQKP